MFYYHIEKDGKKLAGPLHNKEQIQEAVSALWEAAEDKEEFETAEDWANQNRLILKENAYLPKPPLGFNLFNKR